MGRLGYGYGARRRTKLALGLVALACAPKSEPPPPQRHVLAASQLGRYAGTPRFELQIRDNPLESRDYFCFAELYAPDRVNFDCGFEEVYIFGCEGRTATRGADGWIALDELVCMGKEVWCIEAVLDPRASIRFGEGLELEFESTTEFDPRCKAQTRWLSISGALARGLDPRSPNAGQ